MKSITLLLAASLFIVSCNQSKKADSVVITSPIVQNFINPPLKGVDVPFKNYSVDAAQGDTVFYQTVSIILFPPNSFVDKDGKIIVGNVDITYREFTDPIDFYLSGIPMDYDSSGKKYTFESAGMCEIHAYKDGVPVFVNPASKPSINLVSNTTSSLHNLYYLDTVKHQWIYRGTSEVFDMRPKKSKNIEDKDTGYLMPPVMPSRANDLSPVITVLIDPASFRELRVYDNLKFQVDPHEKNFDPRDTSQEWNNIKLEKGTIKGSYKIKFSNAAKTVEYNVHPVLEGEDYDKALTIFEKNNEVYTKNMAARNEEEKKIKETNNEEYVKASMENAQYIAEAKRIKDLNVLIRARNKEIAKENILIFKEIRKQNAIADSINKERIKETEAADLSYNILRNFEIDGFGIWNCDHPISEDAIKIIADFRDKNDSILKLRNIAVIYKTLKGILYFGDNGIKVLSNNVMIFGIYNDKLAFINYDEYNKLGITPATTQQVFTMTVVPAQQNYYDYIKMISGNP